MSKYLSIQDISNMFGVSEPTVRRWIRDKKISGHKAGAQWRFDKDTIQRAFENGSLSPTKNISVPHKQPNQISLLPDWAKPLIMRWKNALDNLLYEFNPDHIIVNDRRGANIWNLLGEDRYTWGNNLWHSSVLDLISPTERKRLFANKKILLFDEMMQYGRDMSRRRILLEKIGADVEIFICIRRKSIAESSKLVASRAYVCEDLDDEIFAKRATALSKMLFISPPPLDVDHIVLKGKMGNNFDIDIFIEGLSKHGLVYIVHYPVEETNFKYLSVTLDRPQFFNTTTQDYKCNFNILWDGPCKIRFYIDPMEKNVYCSFIVFPTITADKQVWIKVIDNIDKTRKLPENISDIANSQVTNIQDESEYHRLYQYMCLELAAQMISNFIKSGLASDLGISFRKIDTIIDFDNLKSTFGLSKGSEIQKQLINIINNIELPLNEMISPPPIFLNVDKKIWKSDDIFDCRHDLIDQMPRKHANNNGKKPTLYYNLYSRLSCYQETTIGQVLDYELDWGTIKPVTDLNIYDDKKCSLSRGFYLGEYDPWFQWESSIMNDDDETVRRTLAIAPQVIDQFLSKTGRKNMGAIHIAKIFSNLAHEWRADTYGRLFYFIEPYIFGPIPKIPRKTNYGAYMGYVDFLVANNLMNRTKEKHQSMQRYIYYPPDKTKSHWPKIYESNIDGKTKFFISSIVKLYAEIQKCKTVRTRKRTNDYQYVSLLNDPLVVLASARNEQTAYICAWFELDHWLSSGANLFDSLWAATTQKDKPMLTDIIVQFARAPALLFDKIQMYRNLPYLRQQIVKLRDSGDFDAAHMLLESIDPFPKIRSNSKYPIKRLEDAQSIIQPYSSLIRKILEMCGLDKPTGESKIDAVAYLNKLLSASPELKIIQDEIEKCIAKAGKGNMTTDIVESLKKSFDFIRDLLLKNIIVPDPQSIYQTCRLKEEKHFDIIATLQNINYTPPYVVAALDHKNFMGLASLICNVVDDRTMVDIAKRLVDIIRNCEKNALETCNDVYHGGTAGDTIFIWGIDPNEVLKCSKLLMKNVTSLIAKDFRQLAHLGMLRVGIALQKHRKGNNAEDAGYIAYAIGDAKGRDFGECTITEDIYDGLKKENKDSFKYALASPRFGNLYSTKIDPSTIIVSKNDG